MTAPRTRGVYRLIGFLVVPALNAVMPFLVLPALTGAFGAAGWASVAVAQSLGTAGTAVTELGWGLTGPQRVARQSAANRQAFFAHVMVSKFLAALPVAALLAPVAYLLTSEYRWEAAILAALGCMGSMMNAWFFIGAGQPAKIILADSLPRLVPLVTCAVLLGAGWPIATYVWTIAIVTFLVPLTGLMVVGVGPHSRTLLTARALRLSFLAQRSALTGRVLSSTYIGLSITLVSIVNPGAVALFAAAERLQRMALTVLQAVPNMLQGWVGRPAMRADRLRRAYRGLVINIVVGLVSGIGFSLVAPYASQLIFSGVATIPPHIAAICGLLILIVCTSRVTGGIMLVVLHRIEGVALSAFVGCCVGIPAILVCAWALGPLGGVLGQVIGEAAVLTVQVCVIRRKLRELR